MRLIDAHIHIFDQIKGFGFQGECHPIGGGRVEFDTGLQNQRFPIFLGDTNVTAEKMLEEVMDKNGVEKAVLLQCPSNGLQNQYYHQVWQKYPDRFLPACMIDPEILRFDEILEHMIRDFHYRVFKLEMSMIAGLTGAHVRLNMFDSPNMEKLFAAAEAVGGTVALDIGGPEETSYHPEAVRALALRHPNLHIVMCHLLEPDRDDDERLRKNLELMCLPNVWFDISSLPTILSELPPYDMSRRYLALAQRIVGADRLLWGTDAPGSLVKQDYQTMLKLLVTENGTFTEAEREMICWQNALHAYPFEPRQVDEQKDR